MSLPEPIAKNHCARCRTSRHVLSIHHTYVPSRINYRRCRQYEQDHPPLARMHLQSVPLCASTINAMRGGRPTRLCQTIATHGQHVATCLIDVVPWSARPWRLRKRVDAVYPQVPPAQFVALLALSNRLPPKWRLVESNNPRFVPPLRSVFDLH